MDIVGKDKCKITLLLQLLYTYKLLRMQIVHFTSIKNYYNFYSMQHLVQLHKLVYLYEQFLVKNCLIHIHMVLVKLVGFKYCTGKT